MKLLPDVKVNALIEEYPFLLDFLAAYNPKFSILKNRAMRATMGRMATLSMVSGMGSIPLATLLADIAAEIERQTGKKIEVGEITGQPDNQAKLAELKGIIRDLHAGREFKAVKKRFDGLMDQLAPTEIATLEEELIREGMPVGEIQRLCDLHVSLFKNVLEKEKPASAPPGHPVHTFMAENEVFAGHINTFNNLTAELAKDPGADNFRKLEPDFKAALENLRKVDIHYLRKENQLFPFLEKHGITGPSQVMWGIHDDIRAMLKKVVQALEQTDTAVLLEEGARLSRALIEMIYKENAILYPMALDTLSDEEWSRIRGGEGEIGYAFVTPGTEWKVGGQAAQAEKAAVKSDVLSSLLQLETGTLAPEQVNLLLSHLPIEVSYVDENDEVRYYSETRERIFPRSPGVIGRKVQNCHPPKSLHIVKRILNSFRTGKKDSADFWIQFKGKFILISYYAIRDRNGNYRGTLETVQDISRIRTLKGEKKLLDWEEEN